MPEACAAGRLAINTARDCRHFKSSPEVIRLVVRLGVRYPLSLRNVEDRLRECEIDTMPVTLSFWWNGFAMIFAAGIQRRRVLAMLHFRPQQPDVDDVFVKINGMKPKLRRTVDNESEVLERFATKRRDRSAGLSFLRKTLTGHGLIDHQRDQRAGIDGVDRLRKSPVAKPVQLVQITHRF